MAYDEDLAERVRGLLVDEEDLTEQQMFGGLSFLIAGNMAVAASGQGGVLVRVDPTQADELIATTDAYQADMGGRVMRGWLRVDADTVDDNEQLAKWVRLGAAYAHTLPAK